MLAANYLEAGSELKINVDLAFSLNSTFDFQTKDGESHRQTDSEVKLISERILNYFRF